MDKRPDGYHDIRTLFWRLPSPETVEIRTDGAGDRVACVGTEIPGENIVSKGCVYLRQRHGNLMPEGLDIRIFKHLPQGSGVGAGSGNVAALLRWFRHAVGGNTLDVASLSSLGADVAFLATDDDLAFASGVGERLEGVGESLDLAVVLFFPTWPSDTGRAYRSLDESRAGTPSKILTPDEARAESFAILDGLRRGDCIGLLPNDFIPCMGEHRVCYNALYEAIRDFGAIAWGLSGSGSSCFGLFRRAEANGAIPALARALRDNSRFDWLTQTLILE
ncbi:hypothetical protein LJC31_07710 [Synergistaceae bacterium OttesenSCG-928-I11]|nr:hypothetical protein [Synergistaceae bacterium OttesenSCG-928-I11]